MIPNSILPMKTPLAPARETSLRRTSHGGSAFSAEPRLLQPQDGASIPAEVKGRVSTIHARLHAGGESEDARLTGLTRSLFRRLMGLNVMTAPTTPVPVSLARKAQRVIAMTEPTTKVA